MFESSLSSYLFYTPCSISLVLSLSLFVLRKLSINLVYVYHQPSFLSHLTLCIVMYVFFFIQCHHRISSSPYTSLSTKIDINI